MAIIGAINGLQAALPQQLNPATSANKAGLAKDLAGIAQTQQSGATQETSFGKLFEGMIDAVDGKQKEASALTKQVLLGNTDQLHQSVIAMQEASVSFSLMLEVRNKLVESYQELMRMPV